MDHVEMRKASNQSGSISHIKSGSDVGINERIGKRQYDVVDDVND